MHGAIERRSGSKSIKIFDWIVYTLITLKGGRTVEGISWYASIKGKDVCVYMCVWCSVSVAVKFSFGPRGDYFEREPQLFSPASTSILIHIVDRRRPRLCKYKGVRINARDVFADPPSTPPLRQYRVKSAWTAAAAGRFRFSRESPPEMNFYLPDSSRFFPPRYLENDCFRSQLRVEKFYLAPEIRSITPTVTIY